MKKITEEEFTELVEAMQVFATNVEAAAVALKLALDDMGDPTSSGNGSTDPGGGG